MRRLGALLAILLAVAGCGLGVGKSSGEVTVTVSRDFGETNLEAPKTAGARDESVMRLLQRSFDGVETRYGGGFVQEIDGVSGGRENGKRVDWFYYVNGIEAAVGANQRKVFPGDRIWWDHHDWEAAMRIPAVVGSYPEPFLDGSEGKKMPVRLVCLDTGRSCDEVQARLADEDVKGVARSSLANSIGRGVLRLIVGPWSKVRIDPAARLVGEGPQASGVYARPDRSGRRLTLLDPAGKPALTLGAGAGLVAAARAPDQQPTWLITGTDEVGVAAAAAALNEDQLRNHFALAVNAGTGIPLPVQEP